MTKQFWAFGFPGYYTMDLDNLHWTEMLVHFILEATYKS